MHCPNCGQDLKTTRLGNRYVYHCPNCGGSFFEENTINRITLDEARQLAKDKKTDEISGFQKVCPKDSTILKQITADEAVPQHVTLLRCKTCGGVFTYPDDLINFKEAQEAKISYYKTWGLPFSPLKTVLVLSSIVFLFVSIYFGLQTIQERPLPQLKAEDFVRNLTVSSEDRYIFISFQTEKSFSSKIVILDKTEGSFQTKTISKKLTKIHFITLTDIDKTHEVTIRIILFDEKGQTIQTEEKELNTN